MSTGAAAVRQALEAALAGMAGIMPITSSSVAVATVITAPAHGLKTGDVVTITGHTGSTPAISGAYKVTITGANTFTIPVTVTVAGTGGAWTATAWQNRPFNPPAAPTPYQQCYVLFARPLNQEMGSTHQEVGYMQVTLNYPLGSGAGAAEARAELIRAAFKRGNSFTASGVTVNITHTPSIEVQDDPASYAVIVKIRFKAFIL